MTSPERLLEQAKRQAHEQLLRLDDDYRFECACCTEQATYDKYSWFELRERLDWICVSPRHHLQGARDLRSHTADAMAYALAAKIDDEVFTKLMKEGP